MVDFRSGERELSEEELLDVVAGIPREEAIKNMRRFLEKEAELLEQDAMTEELPEELSEEPVSVKLK